WWCAGASSPCDGQRRPPARDGYHTTFPARITTRSHGPGSILGRPRPAPRAAPKDPVSTDQIAEKTDEPASPPPLATAGRAVVTAARRLPVTAVIVAALLVTGVVFEALFRSARHATWFPDVAYGVPALEGGRWWTLVTGPWLGLTPLQHLSL